MKLSVAWIVWVFVLGYGLLPVSFLHYHTDFDLPNVLLIERQVCGCPCAEGFVKQGQFEIPKNLALQFPELDKKGREVTLQNFPPFENLSNENPMTFDFANNTTFKVKGQVVGVDTILCNPESCEIVPKFDVQKWTTASYYPRFWRYSKVGFFLYLIT